MSSPARSMSAIASRVASSCAASRNRGSTRHSARIRTRGGPCDTSISRSMSQSGCGYEPTTVVGSSGRVMDFATVHDQIASRRPAMCLHAASGARRKGRRMATHDRFLTTHIGSLPRSEELIQIMFAREDGIPLDRAALEARVVEAVDAVVAHQLDAGIDIINDGEMSKPSYATYVKDRLMGFGGTGNTFVYQDLAEFPNLAKRVFGDPGRSRRKTPACNAAIAVRDGQAAAADVANLKAALKAASHSEAFMSAASPGVIA